MNNEPNQVGRSVAPPQDDARYKPNILAIILDIAFNTAIPLGCYYLAKRYLTHSEFNALLIASVYPILKNIYEVTRHKDINPISAVILLGIASNAIAISLGGSPKLLLIRESFFTGAFGIACLISLFFRKPLMFYFGRHFVAGKNPELQKQFDSALRFAKVRMGHRIITAGWGFVYLGEFALRVYLAWNFPPATVLAVSPFLIGGATVAAIALSFRMGAQIRKYVIAAIAAERANADHARG